MPKWKGKKVSHKRLFDLKSAAEWREFTRHRNKTAVGRDVKFYANGELIGTAKTIDMNVTYGE
ncbi:hypothetical protein [Phage f2b1]|nr:hypothetical protein [Phage f2b1]